MNEPVPGNSPASAAELTAGVNTQLKEAGHPPATNPEDESVFRDIGDIATRIVGESKQEVLGGQEENQIGTGVTLAGRFKRWVADRIQKKT